MAETHTQPPLRWGILGAGSIANRFCTDVTTQTAQKIAAVGSRDQTKADNFADKYDAPHRHTTYEALVNDDTVDCIYVATPHPFHREHSLLALAAGKPVLCEKPFTINIGEAREVIAAANSAKLFLMEGMWTRCFPVMAKVRELIAEGAIGTPMMVYSDFGFRAGFNPEGRAFKLELGGGALMDVGVYPISFAQMILGKPDRIAGFANMGQSGVDEESAFLLGFPSGGLATLSTAVRLNTTQVSTILGTDGHIVLPAPAWRPKTLILKAKDREETFERPYEGGGFQFEAEHVAQCLADGLLESPLITHEMTLDVMTTLDTLRAQFGLRYPADDAA